MVNSVMKWYGDVRKDLGGTPNHPSHGWPWYRNPWWLWDVLHFKNPPYYKMISECGEMVSSSNAKDDSKWSWNLGFAIYSPGQDEHVYSKSMEIRNAGDSHVTKSFSCLPGFQIATQREPLVISISERWNNTQSFELLE